jgi:hypothetical protein
VESFGEAKFSNSESETLDASQPLLPSQPPMISNQRAKMPNGLAVWIWAGLSSWLEEI